MALYRDPQEALRRLAAGEFSVANNTPAPDAPLPTTEELRREGLQRRYDASSESRRALDQGIENLKASGYGARGLARILLTGNEQGGVADLQHAQQIQSDAAEFGPQVQSVSDVHDLGSGLEYARNIALQQAPNIALTLGTGLVGGGAKVAASSAIRSGVEKGLARGIATNIADRTGAKAVERRLVKTAQRRIARKLGPVDTAAQFAHGSEAGAVASGIGLQSSMAPEIVLDPDAKGTVKQRAGAAAVGAIATGALEALPVTAMFRKYGLIGAEKAVTGSIAARFAKQGAKQGLVEAGTEVAQQVGERAAHKWVNENVDLMGPEAYSEYLNAAAGGFFGGGIFGAPAGLRGAGRDSKAGKSYAQSIRDFTDRLRPPNKPQPGPSGPAPGTPVSEGDPLDLSSIRQHAAGFVKQVQDVAGPAAKAAGQKLNDITATFSKTLGDLGSQTATDNSISDILDAEPYNLKTESNGLSTLNDGKGAPFAQFADARRARNYVLAGDDAGLAAIKSTVPENRVDELAQTGALGAAAKVLRGDSKVDDGLLRQYEAALPPEARPMFHRAAATALKAASEDVQMAPRDPGATQTEPTTAQKNAGIADTERALPRAKDAVAFVRKASGGLLREGAPVPANHFVVQGTATSKAGATKTVNRAVSGEALGKLVQNLRREDPNLDTRSALVQAVNDLALGGMKIDPKSLQGGLRLGRDWLLTAAMAKQLTGDLANPNPRADPGKFRLRQQTTQSTSQRTLSEQQQRDLERDPGVQDRPTDTHQPEMDTRADAPRELGPRDRSPLPTRVAPSGKLLEGETLDSTPVNPDAKRAEAQTQYGRKEKIDKVDSILEKALGKRPTTFEQRNAAINEARAKLTGEKRKAFNEHVLAMHKALRDDIRPSVDRLKARADEARAAWKADKSPETLAVLRKAAAKYDKARRGAEARFHAADRAMRAIGKEVAAAHKDGERLTPPVDRNAELKAAQRKDQRAAKAKKETLPPGPDSFGDAVDHSASASPEGAAGEIVRMLKSRSRRGLYALKNKVANSTFPSDVKARLQTQIDEAVAALRAKIKASGRVEFSQNDRRTSTAEAFENARDKLANVDTVEGALRAMRETASTPQKAMIDILLGMGAVKNVPFSTTTLLDEAPGMVSGVHASGIATSKAINSRVELKFSWVTAGGPSIDVTAVLIHEAVHAATSYAEQTSPETRAAVEQLLEHARNEARKLGIDPDTLYGLSETQEFLAEAFSNAELQSLLQSMPAANTAKFQSLWEEFKDFVKMLLGFENVPPSALDEIFTLGLDLARETAAARNEAMESLTGETAAEYSGTDLARTPAAGGRPSDYMAFLNPNERRFLDGAFRRGDVYRQIKAAIPAELQATLLSADQGPSLLVNTGLALAMQGKLNMQRDTKTLEGAVGALWDTISQVLQVPSKHVYARQVIASLREGDPASKIDVQEKLLKPAALQITRYINANVAPKVLSFTRDIDARMRKSGVPALTQLATLISQRTGEFRADGTAPLVARRTAERNKRLNDFFKITQGWDDKRKLAVLKALQENNEGGFIESRGAFEHVNPDVTAVREFFRDMHDYLKGAGLKLGKIENYFPVAVDPARVAKNRERFIKLMSAKNFAETLAKRKLTPEKLYHAATAEQTSTIVGDVTFADGDHDPAFRPLNHRLMDFVLKEGTPEQIAEFAQFQDQSLDRVVVGYVTRGVRRAEWTRAGMGTQVSDLMAAAAKQGATPEQLQMAKDYVDQAMGAYRIGWHPLVGKIAKKLGIELPSFKKFQTIQSGIIAYQNLRLLPLAALSSLIDPLGVSIRDGGSGRVFSAYRDALRAMRDTHGNDHLRGLAEDMGIVERHAVAEALAYMYGGASDPTGLSARVNAAIFKYNGLEYITKFSRLAALSTGNRFLISHARGQSPHSARYLRELGLTAADIKVGPDGFVLRNDKIDAALTRFVDESVVRPTATQRPSWQNDPHFALAAQYKGYLYSFWNTVVRRAAIELDNNNPRVLTPLLMYLPVTALGEMMRDVAQGDDEDRDAKAYAQLALSRSGLLGPQVNLLQNVHQDMSYHHSVLNSLTGPTGQQLVQAYDASNGERSAARTGIEALPASALFEDWFQ